MGKIKSYLLVPRQACREILSPGDAARMLASGSWVRAVLPRSKYRNAVAQHKYRERCREQGCRRLHVVLSQEVFAALQAAKREKETMAQLLERLLGDIQRTG